ncbi:MFS transporter [Metabacillus arenae]|uniref:MFS transporter n=1 Tax=Metabacillus arenae TaxID=2771434 RepID=A0A926RYV2_9BACI|nr:MFS transporter [Metabacillus arenae]MBD1382160.1 MFS transporter [Metabacillus arenae]
MLLRNSNFLYFWFGQTASIFGSRLSDLAIPWIALQLTNSPMQTALITMSSQLAPLIFSLPAGAWVESRSKIRMAMLSEAARAVMITLLAIFVFSEQFNEWVVFFLLFFSGFSGLIFRISTNAMLPSLVGRKHLLDAHNYLEGADAISTFIGPLLAGFIFTALGAGWTIAIDAATYFVSLLGICFICFEPNKSSIQKDTLIKGTTFKLALEGILYMFASPLQRFLSFNHIMLNFLSNAVILLVIIYSKDSLNLNPAQTGILLSAAGLGNIAAVLLLDRMKWLTWRTLYFFSTFVTLIGILCISTGNHFYVLFIGMFLFDGALSMGFVIHGTSRQSVTPDRLLSRISSGGLFISGIATITGHLYAGGLAEMLGARLGLLFCSVLLVLAILYSLSKKEMRLTLQELEPEKE